MISPSGGVASRTLPDAFEREGDAADVFGEDLVDVFGEALVGAFEVVDFFDDVDPDAAEPDFFGVERFLEGPHVVMTLNTVPRRCHTEP